jgi:hypothetical protein
MKKPDAKISRHCPFKTKHKNKDITSQSFVKILKVLPLEAVHLKS